MSETKFLSFASLQALHQGQTMEGCSAPLVVKFADTQKEKDAKRVQSIQSNLWNFAAGLNSPLAPSPVPVASPIHTSPPVTHSSPYLSSEALPATSLQLLQQIQAFGLQQQLLHGEFHRRFFFFAVLMTEFLIFRLRSSSRASTTADDSG
jgi:bruno